MLNRRCLVSCFIKAALQTSKKSENPKYPKRAKLRWHPQDSFESFGFFGFFGFFDIVTKCFPAQPAQPGNQTSAGRQYLWQALCNTPFLVERCNLQRQWISIISKISTNIVGMDGPSSWRPNRAEKVPVICLRLPRVLANG